MCLKITVVQDDKKKRGKKKPLKCIYKSNPKGTTTISREQLLMGVLNAQKNNNKVSKVCSCYIPISLLIKNVKWHSE